LNCAVDLSPPRAVFPRMRGFLYLAGLELAEEFFFFTLTPSVFFRVSNPRRLFGEDLLVRRAGFSRGFPPSSPPLFSLPEGKSFVSSFFPVSLPLGLKKNFAPFFRRSPLPRGFLRPLFIYPDFSRNRAPSVNLFNFTEFFRLLFPPWHPFNKNTVEPPKFLLNSFGMYALEGFLFSFFPSWYPSFPCCSPLS